MMAIATKEGAARQGDDTHQTIHSHFINVPQELQEQCQTFCLWRYDADGRKKPFDWTATGKTKDAKGNNAPELHLSFNAALSKLRTHQDTGLAIYQPNETATVMVDTRMGYLHILDLDGFCCDGVWDEEAERLWEMTRQTYIETSPSGVGLKMLLVSDAPPVKKTAFKFTQSEFAERHPEVRKYRARAVEVFSKGFWNTLTGKDSKGSLQFIGSVQLRELLKWMAGKAPEHDKEGFDKKDISSVPLPFEVPKYFRQLKMDTTTYSLMGHSDVAETLASTEQVHQWLDVVGADCDYETWRNVLWAVASLDWEDGQELARGWSMTAPERFNESGFMSTWCSYRPGGIGIGTLARLAKAAGWVPSRAKAAVTPHTSTAQTYPMHELAVPAVLAQNGWVANAVRFTLADLTADKLFTGTPPAQKWLCEGVFPAGKVCVLASPPGVGKSYLALDLACKVARSQAMNMAFGGAIRSSGRSVYISAEDDKPELHRRLYSLMAGNVMPERLHVLSLPDVGHFGVIGSDEYGKLGLTDEWRELVLQIKALDDVRLVVIDTFQAMSSGDTNDAAAVQPFMNECAELATTTGATVLLLHHVAKGSTKDVKTALDAAEAIRGSGAIVGSARSAYVLWPPSDGGVKFCEALGELYVEGAVAIGMVAKANGAARRDRVYFLRDHAGLLRDVTTRYMVTAAASNQALHDELARQVQMAYDANNPFAAGAGTNGLHKRQHELPAAFHDKSRSWFDTATKALIAQGRIKPMKYKSGFRLAPEDVAEVSK